MLVRPTKIRRIPLRQISNAPARFFSEPSAHPASTFTPAVGLELHVQLKSSKLFSPETPTEGIPNSHIAPFDAALPGTLPRLNLAPVRLAILASLALSCQIQKRSSFDRKHYFYPDIPPGWQITQQYAPLALNGKVELPSSQDGLEQPISVRIRRIHLEQDTARSMRDAKTQETLVNLNRAGSALIEIVTEPDMNSALSAAFFVQKLQRILQGAQISDGNMEEGSIRCDANVSVHSKDYFDGKGTRCEIKNLNGLKTLATAITYEIDRQTQIVLAGGKIDQETRGFDPKTGETFSLRKKGDNPDYRYMPDPELPHLIVKEETLEELRNQLSKMPPLPNLSDFDISERNASILSELGKKHAGAVILYFERVMKEMGEENSGIQRRSAQTVSNWIVNDLTSCLNEHDLEFDENPISAKDLAHLIDAVEQGKLNSSNGKRLLKDYITQTQSGNPPSVDLHSLVVQQTRQSNSSSSSSPDDHISSLCDEIVKDLAGEVEKVKAGKTNVMKRLIGEGMKRSRGKVDPKRLEEVLKRRVEER